jgi:anti-anti-sigma factor
MSSSEAPCVEIQFLDGCFQARIVKKVVLSGEIADQVGHQLLAIARQPGRRLLLDFENVTSLTSSMLSQLVQVQKALAADGGRLAICHVRPDVYDIFEVTRLTTLLTIYETKAAAIAALQD